MGTMEEWEQKIEARKQNIMQAFLEYARDNELPAFYTPYFFSRQILSDESIVLKHCMVMSLIESGVLVTEGESLMQGKYNIKER